MTDFLLLVIVMLLIVRWTQGWLRGALIALVLVGAVLALG